MLRTIIKTAFFTSALFANSAEALITSSQYTQNDIIRLVNRISPQFPNLLSSTTQLLLSDESVPAGEITDPTTGATPEILTDNTNTYFDYALVDNYGNLVVKLITDKALEERIIEPEDKFNINPLFRSDKFSIFFIFKPTVVTSPITESNPSPRNEVIVQTLGYEGYTNFDELLGTVSSEELKSPTPEYSTSLLNDFVSSGSVFANIKYLSLNSFKDEFPNTFDADKFTNYETYLTSEGISYSTYAYFGKDINGSDI